MPGKLCYRVGAQNPVTAHQVCHMCNIELKENDSVHKCASKLQKQGVKLKGQLEDQRLNDNIEQYGTPPGRKQNHRERNARNQQMFYPMSITTSSESYNFSDPIKIVSYWKNNTLPCILASCFFLNIYLIMLCHKRTRVVSINLFIILRVKKTKSMCIIFSL